MAERSQGVIDQLYEHLLAHHETRSFFQSERHLQNVKRAQVQYFARLFEGRLDLDYYRDRVRVGYAHERIGLGPQWYIGLYSYYLSLLLELVQEEIKDPLARLNVSQSLSKIIFLDMGIAIDTYIQQQEVRESSQARTFAGALTDFSSKLDGASTSILTATTAQAASAQEQATAVAEVTAPLTELRQASAQALDKAETVMGVADQSLQGSRLGTEAVAASLEGIRETREKVDTIAEKILSLSEQSQRIGEIITSVNEIAEQSKLLALNAAIEAARAGDHGRGFAVVAREMRNLADQSKEATAQVRAILKEIQRATNSAVLATEEGTKKVLEGTQLAERAGDTIEALVQGIEESATTAKLIANAARQMGAGIQQVADAMVSINEGTEQTVEGLRGSEQSVSSLTEMSSEMTAMIDSHAARGSDAPEYHLT